MVLVSQDIYDNGAAGGDGLLTEARAYYDDSDYYATDYQYDWRDRQTGVLQPDQVATIEKLDNAGNATKTQVFASASYSFDSGSPTGSISTQPGSLRAQSTAQFDNLGRQYSSSVYNVNPSSGETGDWLTTETWYDAAGNIVKTQTGTTGAFEKFAYDSLGRQVATYTGYALTPETSYDDATVVNDNDVILQQTETWYDAADEAVAAATYQQFVGESVTSALDGTDSYATASATWCDPLGRIVETADYGREDKLAPAGETRYVFNPDGTLNAPPGGLPVVTQGARRPRTPRPRPPARTLPTTSSPGPSTIWTRPSRWARSPTASTTPATSRARSPTRPAGRPARSRTSTAWPMALRAAGLTAPAHPCPATPRRTSPPFTPSTTSAGWSRWRPGM